MKKIREEECLICGKKNLSFFNYNYFFFRKTTPDFYKKILREKGYRYNSKWYLCYNCIKGRIKGKKEYHLNSRECKNCKKLLRYLKKEFKEKGYNEPNLGSPCFFCEKPFTRLKLILKNKSYIIKEDFLDFKGGDIRVKIYWFTIKLDIYGFIYIYDKKTHKCIIQEAPQEDKYDKGLTDLFLNSKIHEIWKRIDENRIKKQEVEK